MAANFKRQFRGQYSSEPQNSSYHGVSFLIAVLLVYCTSKRPSSTIRYVDYLVSNDTAMAVNFKRQIRGEFSSEL